MITLIAIYVTLQILVTVGLIKSAFKASDPIDVKIIKRICRRKL
jgi:hypothetical protein